MMHLKYFSLNDQFYYIDQTITLLDLIRYFNYNRSVLVLELNKLICNKDKWSNIVISDQDKIEIVTIVGGG